jgi:hypothetical protein
MLLLLLLLLEEVHNVGLLGVTGGAVTSGCFHLLGSRGLNLKNEKKNLSKNRKKKKSNCTVKATTVISPSLNTHTSSTSHMEQTDKYITIGRSPKNLISFESTVGVGCFNSKKGLVLMSQSLKILSDSCNKLFSFRLFATVNADNHSLETRKNFQILKCLFCEF